MSEPGDLAPSLQARPIRSPSTLEAEVSACPRDQTALRREQTPPTNLSSDLHMCLTHIMHTHTDTNALFIFIISVFITPHLRIHWERHWLEAYDGFLNQPALPLALILESIDRMKLQVLKCPTHRPHCCVSWGCSSPLAEGLGFHAQGKGQNKLNWPVYQGV